MKPEKSSIHTRQRALFDVGLEDIVDMTHPLVQLAGKIDWRCLERGLGAAFHEYKSAPAKSVRLLILARLLLRAHVFLPFFAEIGEIFHRNFRMPSRLPRLSAWVFARHAFSGSTY